MMHSLLTLSNHLLEVSISTLGAELQNIYHKTTQLEYLWCGDSAYWGKKSPVLFPIVGGLRNQTYTHEQKSYTLGRHGFARERVFSLTHQDQHSVTLTLFSDEASLAVYPFDFSFHVQYTLHNDVLQIGYRVENKGKDSLYFSVGAHPAFAVPLVAGTDFTDYHLLFNRTETIDIWPLSPEGLIEKESLPYMEQSDRIYLNKAMFAKDALVFKELRSDTIAIASNKHPHGVEVSFEGFPYMGIWSTKNANFVCIEPWCGIADSVETSGEISQKEGIQKLALGALFERDWQIRIF